MAKRLFIKLCAFGILLCTWQVGKAQGTISRMGLTYPDSLNEKRMLAWTASGATVYAGSMVGLSQVWYGTSGRQPFTWFNDNAEWLQMDKVGHFYSAYQITVVSLEAWRWTGLETRKARLAAVGTGLLLMAPIEIFDGYSPAYGASWGDLLANSIAPLFAAGQWALWDEQRLVPKFSFTPTPLAAVRPELLGNGLHQEFLKDYNGQTYWLSANLHSFGPKDGPLPPWLNLAVGYGIDDMPYGRVPQAQANGYQPYRQFYLSPDIDFTRIPTRYRWLKTLFFYANMLKMPAPALEYNSQGQLVWHWIMF